MQSCFTWIWKYRAFGLPAINVWTWQCRYTRFQERHQLLTPIWLIPQKNLNYASLYCSFPDKMWYTFDCMSLVCFIFLTFSQFQCYTIVGWVIGWWGRLQFVKLLLHLSPASSSLVKPGLLDVTRKKRTLLTEAGSNSFGYLLTLLLLSLKYVVNYRESSTVHWPRASERINLKLAVLIYRALHGTAPRYLCEELCYVADMPVGERSSPVVDLQSAGCPTVTPRYCCRPFICHNCVSQDLELSSCPWWCHICHIFTKISTKTESTFISTVLPGHYLVAVIHCRGPCSFFYLGHCKCNTFWSIQRDNSFTG